MQNLKTKTGSFKMLKVWAVWLGPSPTYLTRLFHEKHKNAAESVAVGR